MDCLDQRIKENSGKVENYAGRSSTYIKLLKHTPNRNSSAQAYFSSTQAKHTECIETESKGHAFERT